MTMTAKEVSIMNYFIPEDKKEAVKYLEYDEERDEVFIRLTDDYYLPRYGSKTWAFVAFGSADLISKIAQVRRF